MTESPSPPPGAACPHCHEPLEAEVDYCPHCGFAIVHTGSSGPPRKGPRWILAGIAICGLALFVFFFSCLGSIGGGKLAEVVLQISMALGGVGILVILIGAALAILEARRT